MRRPVKISGSAAGNRMRHTISPRAELEDAAGLDQDRPHVAHRVDGEQGDRDDAVDGAERDLGGHAEAEDQQQDRIERHLRDRIERDQHRLEHVAGEPAEAERRCRSRGRATTAMASAAPKAVAVSCRCGQKVGRDEQVDRVAQRLPRRAQARSRRPRSTAPARATSRPSDEEERSAPGRPAPLIAGPAGDRTRFSHAPSSQVGGDRDDAA